MDTSTSASLAQSLQAFRASGADRDVIDVVTQMVTKPMKVQSACCTVWLTIWLKQGATCGDCGHQCGSWLVLIRMTLCLPFEQHDKPCACTSTWRHQPCCWRTTWKGVNCCVRRGPFACPMRCDPASVFMLLPAACSVLLHGRRRGPLPVGPLCAGRSILYPLYVPHPQVHQVAGALVPHCSHGMAADLCVHGAAGLVVWTHMATCALTVLDDSMHQRAEDCRPKQCHCLVKQKPPCQACIHLYMVHLLAAYFNLRLHGACECKLPSSRLALMAASLRNFYNVPGHAYRYPDVVVHRLLAAAIAKGAAGTKGKPPAEPCFETTDSEAAQWLHVIRLSFPLSLTAG